MMGLRIAIIFGILALNAAFASGQDHTAPASSLTRLAGDHLGFLTIRWEN